MSKPHDENGQEKRKNPDDDENLEAELPSPKRQRTDSHVPADGGQPHKDEEKRGPVFLDLEHDAMLRVRFIMDKTFPCTATCDTLIHMGRTTSAATLIYNLLLLFLEISRCLAPKDRPEILKSPTFLVLEGMHAFLRAGDDLIWRMDNRHCTFVYDKEQSSYGCLLDCFGGSAAKPSKLIYGWLLQMRANLVEWCFENNLTIFKQFTKATDHKKSQ